MPEAANFNFAPYIKVPKLVVNGRQDEEHPWQTRGKPLWDLLREPKELLMADAAGHHVPADVRTPRINAFLDRTLGAGGSQAPVKGIRIVEGNVPCKPTTLPVP